MEHYQTSDISSTLFVGPVHPKDTPYKYRLWLQDASVGGVRFDSLGTPPESPVSGDAVAAEASLVNTFISQQDRKSANPVESLSVWPRAVKLVRERRESPKPETVPALRGEIQSFSAASRRRLKFTSSNAFPSLISQFGMTYHVTSPDGRTVKRHLNSFLVAVRRAFPGVGYLWILEFQKRGTAHVHLFTTLEHSAETGVSLGTIWNRIAEPGNDQHLQFHQHVNNFIPWDMGSGSYLCKYLDKEAQKSVPAGFTGVGRFWGNSRGLVPDPEEVSLSDVSEFMGEYVGKYVVRTLCRHHENALKGSPWKSSARKRATCYTLPNGAVIVRQLLQFLQVSPSPVPPPPF